MEDSRRDNQNGLILAALAKRSIQIPPPRRLREVLKNKYHLPAIRHQTDLRRIRTEPDEQGDCDVYKLRMRQRELTRLKFAFSMSGSDILSNLSRKLESLQAMQIVSGGAVRTIRYEGHIKIPTVHNDYHNSKTNAGYSRNKYGGIYPK